MKTFDDALYELYEQKLISEEEALKNADSQNNLSLKIRLAESGSADLADGYSMK
jgi:twitching motility protein PilU